MVVYSHVAKQDLIDILFGLLTWDKHELSVEHCEHYVDQIVDVIDTIDKQAYHRSCTYQIHKKYGTRCFTLKRNDQTQWYCIYDWDKKNKIAYVQKIINNHLTKE